MAAHMHGSRAVTHAPPPSPRGVQAMGEASLLVRELAAARGTPALLGVIARATACAAHGGRFVKDDLIAAARAVAAAAGPWDPAVAEAFGSLLRGL
jgi:hypothetical protein